MTLDLHINQKVINEDGNTTVSFISSSEDSASKYFSLTVKTIDDTFNVGKEYSLVFTEKA